MISFPKLRPRDYEADHTVMTVMEYLARIEPDPLSQCPVCLMTGSRSEVQAHIRRGHIRLVA